MGKTEIIVEAVLNITVVMKLICVVSSDRRNCSYTVFILCILWVGPSFEQQSNLSGLLSWKVEIKPIAWIQILTEICNSSSTPLA